jgi:hypothetical protein
MLIFSENPPVQRSRRRDQINLAEVEVQANEGSVGVIKGGRQLDVIKVIGADSLLLVI